MRVRATFQVHEVPTLQRWAEVLSHVLAAAVAEWETDYCARNRKDWKPTGADATPSYDETFWGYVEMDRNRPDWTIDSQEHFDAHSATLAHLAGWKSALWEELQHGCEQEGHPGPYDEPIPPEDL